MSEDPVGAVAREIELARNAMPTWSLSRQQQLVWGVRGQLQAKRRRGSTVLLALGAAAAIALGVVSYRAAAPSATEVRSAEGGTERWDLRDGSRITIPTPTTILKKKSESETELTFELEAGAASFEVAKKPKRTFKVHSGQVLVQVLGTSFEVAREEGRSRVVVEHGTVLVSWPGGSRTLTKGESGVFPPEPEVKVAANLPDTSSPATAKSDPSPSAPEEVSPGALFASADAARKAGRPEQAIGFLKAITDRYPSDARAPLAAFTRGRVLLESLGRPAEAAAAFAQARSFTRAKSALAEDALAREVEAHRAAGSLGLARERAELYRRNFPKGLRLNQVLRSGGLQEAP